MSPVRVRSPAPQIGSHSTRNGQPPGWPSSCPRRDASHLLPSGGLAVRLVHNQGESRRPPERLRYRGFLDCRQAWGRILAPGVPPAPHDRVEGPSERAGGNVRQLVPVHHQEGNLLDGSPHAGADRLSLGGRLVRRRLHRALRCLRGRVCRGPRCPPASSLDRSAMTPSITFPRCSARPNPPEQPLHIRLLMACFAAPAPWGHPPPCRHSALTGPL